MQGRLRWGCSLADLSLQPSISSDLRSQALLQLADRLSALDLSPILVYRIVSLVDSAVLAMAWQWDVLNPLLLPAVSQLATLAYPGWDAVANVDQLVNIDLLQYQGAEILTPTQVQLYAQYRALIQISTQLHSTLGTPAALKNALAQLGYSGAIVQEGQNTWGSTEWPSDEGWAVFRVLINLATVPADVDITSLVTVMTAVCNYWKPARCWLDSVQFQWYLADTVTPPVTDVVRSIFMQHDFLSPLPGDFIIADAWPISDTKTINPFYNDRYYFGSNITEGEAQPHAADGPVVVNGVAVTVNQ
jgi:tail protein P2 I